ncbi:LuxR C-terminal-related transcriptional regulator [Paraburkholderia aspalathi]|uniref:LuxR C-terminal-related transcriptional regulator n=1 Tax=Paraburkholderia aspalathi TaxID=1324617 RepID=UPI0038BD874D
MRGANCSSKRVALSGRIYVSDVLCDERSIVACETAALAEAMGVKESTVETYAKRAFAKLGVNSRRGLLSLVHRQEATKAA